MTLIVPELLIPCIAVSFGQTSLPAYPQSITLEGVVRTSMGQPVAGVSVRVEFSNSETAKTRTSDDGTFTVSVPASQSYRLITDKPGFCALAIDSNGTQRAQKKTVNLVLRSSEAGCPSESPNLPSMAMQLEDKPRFTIAGITDSSGAGGHGSDMARRASESLARDTLTLKSDGTSSAVSPGAAGHNGKSEVQLRAAVRQAPQSFLANRQLGQFYMSAKQFPEAIPLLEAALRINPGDHDNAYDLVTAYKAVGDFAQARQQIQRMQNTRDHADWHRLLGDLDELQNDPLSAVREYERAARLEPSEQNYFSWGAELLLHRAVQPAITVFTNGTHAHPDSARLLAGLGAALYAGGSYDDAARHVCQASELQPDALSPYLFLGTMEKAVTQPLPCAKEKLALFVQKEPRDALANYYYAVSLWKRSRRSEGYAGWQQVEKLLLNAVKADPKNADAYLQLGLLYATQRKFDKAILAYQEAIKANPNLSEAHYGIALAYRRTGQESNARQEFQAYSQVEKTNTAAIELRRREVRQFLVVMQDSSTAIDHE